MSKKPLRVTLTPSTVTPGSKVVLRVHGRTTKTCRLTIRRAGASRPDQTATVAGRLRITLPKKAAVGSRIFTVRCGSRIARARLTIRKRHARKPKPINSGSTPAPSTPAPQTSTSGGSSEPPSSGATGTTTAPASPSTPTPVAAPVTPVVPPAPLPDVRRDAYSNYGPASAGFLMCLGNPGRPESMPGGTVSQTFTVPAGMTSIDHALVQMDPDAILTRRTASMTVYVNGSPRASTAANPSGDTHFSFSSVGVSAGATVTISITFSGSFGKLIALYRAANVGGTLTASNSCPDGAASFASGDGLRAVVSGWGRP